MAQGEAASRSPASGRSRLLLFALSAVLVALPFFAVTIPPITDLPQHLAQVRLAGEALEGGSPYAIQWGTPYSLVYLLLGAVLAVLPPFAAGRVATAVLAILWVGALHLLAARLRRPPEAAVLAGLLVFNHTLYWGFLPFLLGFPVFALWLLWLEGSPGERRGWMDAAGTALLGLALYLSHALWFAAGLAWLGVQLAARGLEARRRGGSLRPLLPRLLGGAAVAGVAVAWFARLSSTAYATEPLWVPPVWRRLAPASWVEAAFGGLAGNLESVALVALLGWLAVAVWQHPKRLTAEGDRRLALLGGLLVVGALVLPDKYVNTIEFNDRWMPPGLALLLLAAPPLRLPRLWARWLSALLLAAFVLVTALAWNRIERVEMAGLQASLEAVEDGGRTGTGADAATSEGGSPRVLGLDFLRGSRFLDRQPFLQAFAWSQVLHGGTLNFSFADFPPSLVVFSPPRRPPWTSGLEWYPQMLRREDLGWFDYVLARGTPAIQRQLDSEPALEPVTPPAPWRLYRVRPDAPREVFTLPGPPPGPPATPPEAAPTTPHPR